ncbi:hypothetical protein MI467_02230 [Delftia acidovorans]|jgi:hypothetical protein|uniref:hypothetical protein n=1 Tax=Delftia acidovorans TaxID=80866 RepID=UPI001EFECD57|nr:hypothetical protein [Delftia acidovorans]MCG8985656.1 hypothetical protein [Delftia acidovorans]
MKVARINFAIMLTSFLSANVLAEGWIESASNAYTDGAHIEGWACNPATPGTSGWVHFWSGSADNKFLGALPANIQREQAVGSICGDSGRHGFGGSLSVPYAELDGKKHKIIAYYVGENGQPPLLLQNHAYMWLDGGYVLQTKTECNGANPAPGHWIKKTVGGKCILNTGLGSTTWGLSITHAFVSNAPSGYQMEACEPGPAGWATISTNPSSSNCMKFDFNANVVTSPSYIIKKN